MNTLATAHMPNPVSADLWSLAPHQSVRHDARRVLIAVATADGARVDCDFEEAEAFLLYENHGCQTCFVGRQPCPLASDGGEPMGKVILLADCDLVLCSNVSDSCKQALSEMGIDCNLGYAGAMVSDAVSAFQQETVAEY